MSGRSGLQEIGAELDRESGVHVMCRVVLASRKLEQSWTENLLRQRFSVHSRKGREIDHTHVVHSLKDRENHQKIFERKVDLAARGEREAQQQLYEAEAEVEARNWEKRNSDIVLHEIKKLNLNDFSYTKQVDGRIRFRERKSVCMENRN